MIIYGSGGHSKVVMSACTDEVKAFFDDHSNQPTFRGKPVFPYTADTQPKELVVIAIGDNKVRQMIANTVRHSFGTVVDKSVIIDSSCIVGKGSQVLHGAIIQADAEVGEHTIVNTGASIDHDSKVGDFCHIAPQVTLCGSVTVGDGTIIGAGSTIIPGITIGKWCKIGAGSVVTKNVPDNGIAVGNPARVIKT